eukprot:CAMPEP_0204824406 /NCGR_PEP_ID=MMETSP1346-20131115/2436_1 /ASSEMBLY_ACC=CAM_ASM_000771 /TAXON_ID=215587 /ORGANISM="Aplanochytrium stocchinoi, Strain GSBS06" /LENGTH=255 /DNA_ID=CAMNT_0051951549 /DNA_START=457 /DNA_END=1225 /DNA_ORIENTATION=-
MKKVFGKLGIIDVAKNHGDHVPDAIILCPFADTSRNVDIVSASDSGCPFHSHTITNDPPLTEVPDLVLRNGFSFEGNEESADLIRNIGGGDRIREGCTRFYARAFEDHTLSPFMTVFDDGAENHGNRLGNWIVEKIGSEGTPWTDSGRGGLRQQTHFKAWNSPGRDPRVRGQHFKLDDCIIWMRIHFWAMREVGLSQYPAFWTYYKDFIGHFIAVYERQAPPHTEAAAEWSADSSNIENYIQDGYKMKGVIGMGR